MFQNALVILRNSRGPILIYGTVLVAFDYALGRLNYYLDSSNVINPESDLYLIVDIIEELVGTAILAILMSTCFSRVARTVERALWKLTNPLDAIRRFFGLWFILMLIRTVARRLMLLASGPITSEEEAFSIVLTSMILTVWIVPIGAFIMFNGRAERLGLEEVRQGLTAMKTQFGTVLIIVLTNFGLLLLAVLAFGEIPQELRPLSEFVTALRVMFIFSCSWVICIYHRDHYEPDNDTDFNF